MDEPAIPSLPAPINAQARARLQPTAPPVHEAQNVTGDDLLAAEEELNRRQLHVHWQPTQWAPSEVLQARLRKVAVEGALAAAAYPRANATAAAVLAALQPQLHQLNHRLEGIEDRLGGVEHRLGGVEDRFDDMQASMRAQVG
jgi:hypothetical protein